MVILNVIAKKSNEVQVGKFFKDKKGTLQKYMAQSICTKAQVKMQKIDINSEKIKKYPLLFCRYLD